MRGAVLARPRSSPASALRVAIGALPWWCGPVGITLAVLGAYILAAFAVHPGPTVPTDAIYIPTSSIPILPTRVDPLMHWDGGWYWGIAENWYRTLPGVQQPANFFPLFPAVAAGLHRALPFLSVPLAGLVANVLATCGAMCLVDRTVSTWPRRHRLALVTVLVSLPTAYFYAVFYSEALFILAVALVVWALAVPGRLWWAPLGVSAATLDRPVGILLLIPLVTVLATRERQRPLRSLLMVATACLGGLAVLAIDRLAVGSALAFVRAHDGWPDHPITMGLRATLHTFKLEMLLRPGNDPVIAMGLWIAALMPLVILAAYRWHRSFAVYAAIAYGLSMVTGGYQSAARYMLVLLPAWIGAIALVRRWRFAWPLFAGVVGSGLVVNLLLVDRFVGWRWAG